MVVCDIRIPLANESTIKGIIRVNVPKMVKIDAIYEGGAKKIDKLWGSEKFFLVNFNI